MNSERAQVRIRRDRSRDRVRRMTLAAGATAAVTGGVLAIGLAGTSQHVASSGSATTPATTAVADRGDDDGGTDDGAVTTQQPAVAPAVAQGTGSVTRSGGS